MKKFTTLPIGKNIPQLTMCQFITLSMYIIVGPKDLAIPAHFI